MTRVKPALRQWLPRRREWVAVYEMHDATSTSTHATPEKDRGPASSSRYVFRMEQEKPHSLSNILGRFRAHLRTTFLPAGYPTSTQPTFSKYCVYQAAHMTFGTATGVLSMQALLYAVGVGAGSVPLAAAVNWVLKDGIGQLGGVVYSSFFGQRFDDDPKRQRFYAIGALQLSCLADVMTPLVPSLFLPLASVSNIGKNISYLASSATRAQMNVSFAKENNLGDITGKIASQSIAASVAGTALGILVSNMTGSETLPVVAAFVPLSILSMAANYRSSLEVHLPTINEHRGEILFHHCLLNPGSAMMTPAQVAAQEYIVLRPVSPFKPWRLEINPDLRKLCKRLPPDQATSVLSIAASAAKNGHASCLIAVKQQEPLMVMLTFGKMDAAGLVHAFYRSCHVRQALAARPEKAFTQSSVVDASDMSLPQLAFESPKALSVQLESSGWTLDGCLRNADAHLDVPAEDSPGGA